TGLRYDDVQAAQLGDAVLERGLQLRGLAYVRLGRDHALAGLLDEGRGLLEILRRGHRVADGVDVLTEVNRDDVGAFLGQPYRMAAPLPACRPGDECDLSLYASHCEDPFR